MNFFELMYTRATSLLRDVFQYLVPGLLFLGLVFFAVLPEWYPWDLMFKNESALWFILIFFIYCIIAYVVGQILFVISYIIFDKIIFGKLFNRFLKELKDKKDQIKRYLNSINIDDSNKVMLNNIPIHLYFEMITFVHRPDLHARFVERYNVLTFMRRSLSSCLFIVFIVYICFLPKTLFFIFIEIIILTLSLILYWAYIRTEIGFLDRVFVCYLVAKEKAGEV